MPCALLMLYTPFSMKLMGAPEEWSSMWRVTGNDEEEVELKLKWIKENLEKAGGKESDHPALKRFTGYLIDMRDAAEMGLWATPGRYALCEVVCSLGDVPKILNTLPPLIAKREKERGMHIHRHENTLVTGPNAHIYTSYLYYDDTDPKQREGILEICKEFFDVAASNGWMADTNQAYTCRTAAKYWTPAFFNFMKTQKQALDPNNIMNPGMWGDLL